MTRTVLVTGASDGIGREVSVSFAGERGCRVIGVSRGPVQCSTAAHLDEHIQADLGTQAGVCHVLEELDRLDVQRLDVLVNCVGIRRDPLPPEASLAMRSDRAVEILWVNFIGINLLIEALATRMSAPGGRIVNVTSRAAYIGGDAVYAASKAALASLQLSLGEPLGRIGITINSVAPGFVPDTGMMRGRVSERRARYESRRSWVGRLGEPGDISRAVLFLASPDSSYITGQTLHVSGGVVTAL